jgi:hypothetical protein
MVSETQFINFSYIFLFETTWETVWTIQPIRGQSFGIQWLGRILMAEPVKLVKTMENHQFFMGKSTMSMAMFNSYLRNYQRVLIIAIT